MIVLALVAGIALGLFFQSVRAFTGETEIATVKALAGIGSDAVKKKIKTFAAVTKFSTRNPDHENQIAETVQSSSDFITLGHKLSGQLSFPRRVVTAYFNSAVWRLYNSFADAIATRQLEVYTECYAEYRYTAGSRTLSFALAAQEEPLPERDLGIADPLDDGVLDVGAQGQDNGLFKGPVHDGGGHFFWGGGLTGLGSVIRPTASTPAFLMMSRVSMKKP